MGNSSRKKNEIIDKPQEACGVFGAVAPGQNISKISYFGLLALQHRGQESAGIAVFDFNHFDFYKNMGLVSQVFNETILNNLVGQIAIGHTRYSTMGDSNLSNAQPFYSDTKQGIISLAHNGNIINAVELRNKLITKGKKLYTTSDSEIITNLIADFLDNNETIETAVQKALSLCKGAFSLTIGTKNKLIAVRDPNGIRPLSLGITVNGDYIVASETCALDMVQAKYLRELLPGEILIIDINKKINSLFLSNKTKSKLCLFELIYFARPDSIQFGKNIHSFRYNLGTELFKEFPTEADIIVPIPDSGISAAIGYSEASGIPYARGFIKNRNIGRTFIQPTQETRELGILQKLNPIKDVFKGKKVVLIDDSIVRGTTCKSIIDLIKISGAKEVHLRISSAPVKYPCFYGIDTDDSKQLIASYMNEKELCKFICAESLKYLSIDGMYKTCSNSSNAGFCMACFNGKYPVKLNGNNRINKMVLHK